MAVRLWILGVFTLILAALWFWSLRSTPRRGLLLLVERLFLGIILCFLLSRIFLPMGISIPTGPAASALTGLLGLPGALPVPNKAAIESNVGRALQMADKSALSYYKVLQEKGFFNRLIAGNVSQMVKVDSIRCDFDRYPYEVTTFARQRILRESTVTERSLVTTCRLVNVSRSDNNPQGFMVEALNIVENKDIATYDR